MYASSASDMRSDFRIRHGVESNVEHDEHDVELDVEHDEHVEGRSERNELKTSRSSFKLVQALKGLFLQGQSIHDAITPSTQNSTHLSSHFSVFS